PAPVLGDSGKEPVLYLIPFAGAGRVVGDNDFQPSRRGESREFVLPEPRPVPVRSTTIGRDEDSAGAGVFLLAHLAPPFLDSRDSEYRCVVIDAHRHPGAIAGQIVNPVGDRFPLGIVREVISGHLDRLPLWMPFLTSLGEPSDELSFLGIDADHGVA